MRVFLASVCALLCVPTLRAVEPAGRAAEFTARTHVETFFRTVIDGDTAKAFDGLMDGSLIPVARSNDVSLLRNQFATALRIYGRPVGFDHVEEKFFGPSLVREVYILRLEKYPLIWEFFFYRGTDHWLPVEVRFNDSLTPFRFDRPTAAAPTDNAPQN